MRIEDPALPRADRAKHLPAWLEGEEALRRVSARVESDVWKVFYGEDEICRLCAMPGVRGGDDYLPCEVCNFWLEEWPFTPHARRQLHFAPPPPEHSPMGIMRGRFREHGRGLDVRDRGWRMPAHAAHAALVAWASGVSAGRRPWDEATWTRLLGARVAEDRRRSQAEQRAHSSGRDPGRPS